MGIAEYITEALASLWPLFIPMAFVTAATILAAAILVPLVSKMRSDSRVFSWCGLFYDLNFHGAYLLTCSWIKFLLLLVYLAMFRELSVMEYFFLAVPALLYAFDPAGIKRLPAKLFWLVIEFIGLFTAQVVCSYIKDMRPGPIFIIIYIAIAIFLSLLDVYLFVTELGDISETRKPQLLAAKPEVTNGREDN